MRAALSVAELVLSTDCDQPTTGPDLVGGFHNPLGVFVAPGNALWGIFPEKIGT